MRRTRAAAVASAGAAAAAAGGTSARRGVVIAGGGPVGLAASALLARYGVPSVVLERAAGLPSHPQAHFLNCRTMELLRHAFPPRLARDVGALVPDPRFWRHFIYTTAVVGGVEVGRVDHFAGTPSRLLAAQSPAGVAHLSQKRLMPLLYREAAEGVGSSTTSTAPMSEVHFGWEVRSFEPTPDGKGIRVIATEAARSDGGKGNGATRTWEGAYLLAADGASSGIRAQAGVGMVGAAGLQHLMNVHFSSRALAEATKHRPAMLYFVYNEEVVCVLVAHRFETGEFVMQLPYFPPVQAPEVRACVSVPIQPNAHTDITDNPRNGTHRRTSTFPRCGGCWTPPWASPSPTWSCTRCGAGPWTAR